jgi:hypothetical protein
MEPRDQARIDLGWFWSESDGELGLQSNFNAIVARIEGRSPEGSPTEIDDRKLDAALRARRISRALGSLPPKVVRILFLRFADRDDKPVLLRLVDVASELMITADHHRRSKSQRPLSAWTARLFQSDLLSLDLDRRRVLREIRSAAVDAVDAALVAFTRANVERRPGQPLQ